MPYLYCFASDVDSCEKSQCVNMGTCNRVGLSEDYVCSCIPGYTGKKLSNRYWYDINV